MTEANPENLTYADFTEAEHAAVDAIAAPIIKEVRNSLAFKGSRNRAAWKRMNRPTKTAKIDAGASFILSFLDRCQPEANTIEEV